MTEVPSPLAVDDANALAAGATSNITASAGASRAETASGIASEIHSTTVMTAIANSR